MKTITTPAPANLTGVPGVNASTLSFEGFYLELVLPKIAITNLADVRLAQSLTKKIEAGVEEDSKIEVSDAEHEAMEKALAKLQIGGRFLSRVMFFYETIYDASEGASATTPPDPPRVA